LRAGAGAAEPAGEPIRDTGLSIYRSQLAELDADRQTGVISEAQYNAARVDLQRSLLEMSGNEGARAARGRSWRWPAGIALLTLLPVLAVLIYQGLGAGPMALESPQRSTAQAEPGGAPPDLEMITATLRARLEQSPDDPVGWALLGRVYHAQGQTRAAVQAYAQSLEYGGNHDADILIDYADVLGTLQNGSLEGRPRDLIRRGLEIEPDHVTGLWLAGTAAYRAGDYAGARAHWQRLAGQLPPQSETGAIIRANLAEVEARIAAQG
jgi:cytochrome c-type biogenesis protein CcmH